MIATPNDKGMRSLNRQIIWSIYTDCMYMHLYIQQAYQNLHFQLVRRTMEVLRLQRIIRPRHRLNSTHRQRRSLF
jgi:hypothetical protein